VAVLREEGHDQTTQIYKSVRAAVVGTLALIAVVVGPAQAHKTPVTAQQLQAYQEAFLAEVKKGRPAVPWRRCHGEEIGRDIVYDRHGLRDVPPMTATPIRNHIPSFRHRWASSQRCGT